MKKNISVKGFFLSLIVLMLVAVTIGSATAGVSTISFTEYPSNPVFDPSAKAYYPSILYDANEFSGRGNTAYYKMWFGSNSGVGYAYSNDGKTWTAGTNPVSSLTNANHPLVEYYQNGFSYGGVTYGGVTYYYRMWYWDQNQLYSMSTIRYAESVDGINWINDQPITGNIITGGDADWNRGSYGATDVIYNPTATNTGTNPFDYSFVMYFDATTGGFEEIGLGYSSDAKNWQLYGKVLPRGNSGAWGNTDNWDSSYTTFGTVVKESDVKWHMWYSGGQAGSNEGIGYATSSDGINWVRGGNNPIFHKNNGVSWRSERTYTPQVIYDTNKFSSHGDSWEYKMWFSGVAAGNYAIGYAYYAPTPTKVYVDDNYNEALCTTAGHTWAYDCFNTVQRAINAVASGGTVNVAAGTYDEQVIIDKSLTLQGAGSDTTNIISPNPSTMTIYDAFGSKSPNSRYIVHRGTNIPVVRIISSDVTFEGFHVNMNDYTFFDVKGSYGSSYSRGTGILVDHVETVPGTPDVFTGITIRNNKVDGLKAGDKGDAIKVLGSATATISNNLIYSYGESAINAQAVDSPTRALYYPTVTANSNTIHGGITRSTNFLGIGYWSGATGSADSNTIYNSPNNDYGYALNAWTPRPVSFTNNIITTDGGSTGGYGAQLYESSNLIFSNNNIEKQGLVGAVWSNPVITISGNTITDSTDGFIVDHQTSGSVTMSSNKINGISTNHYVIKVGGPAGTSSGTVWGNWEGVSTVVVNAENNYWGAANPDFTSIISGDVSHTTWWMDSAMTLPSTFIAIFAGVHDTLFSQGIETNIDECGTTPNSCSGLYFEKVGKGKVLFQNALNLMDVETTTFLQGLGSKMDTSMGHVKFDASTSAIFKATGALIELKGFESAPDTTKIKFVVKDDSGNTLSDAEAVAILRNIHGACEVGQTTCSLFFDAAHFTTFDVKPTVVYVNTAYGAGLENDLHTFGYDAFAKVQDGINAVATGGTVNVAAGMYNEDLQITNDLTLLGPKADSARNTGSATDWTSSTTALWTAEDAQTAGEAVIRSVSATIPSGQVQSAVISIRDGHDVIVKGFVIEARNRIDSTNVHLVYVNAQDATVNSVTIENNIIGPITGVSQGGTKGRMGINFDSQSGGNNGLAGSVKGNKIFGAEGNGNNLFVIGQHYSPSMSDYSGMIIENNDVYGANRAGMELAGGINGLKVRNNIVMYSGLIWDGSSYVKSAIAAGNPTSITYGIGINLIRTSTIASTELAKQNFLENMEVSGNVLKYNDKIGIYTGPMQKNLSIKNNILENNGWDGIRLDESGEYHSAKAYHEAYGYMNGVVIEDNTITGLTDTYAAIKVIGEPQNLVINKNKISGDTKGVVQYDGDGQSWVYTINAENNYWGSASPDFTSIVSGDVDSTPWYIDSGLTMLISEAPGKDQALADKKDVIVEEGKTDIVIPVGSPVQNINISDTVDDDTQVTLDLSSSVINTGTEKTVTLANDLTLSRDTSTAIDYEVKIPTGTIVSGPTEWTGVINVPTVKATSSVTPTADAGTTASVATVVEVGFGDIKLTFNNAVRLLITGQAGKLAGYSRGGVFTKIMATCADDTQATNDLLPADTECKIDVGSDMVIWTKHFTTFAAYTQATTPPASTGGSGASFPGTSKKTTPTPSAIKVPTPAAPVQQTQQVPIEQPTIQTEEEKAASTPTGQTVSELPTTGGATMKMVLLIIGLVLIVTLSIWMVSRRGRA